MERTPAASAMDWSIHLNKSLRSQIPGKCIEALEEIGRRLEWWNREPKLTFSECRFFGLIPGEDKLFLNAIFLRLAEAFRLGNKQIKNCLVRIFLRMKRRNKRDGGGVLCKEKLENYLELLSRVKEVFDKGDAEERALALLLLGCWVCLAKDCLDIRYMVLSSLVAGDVLEMKAAYFAAGCLSEMSDDFANVFLEILRTTVSSHEISKDIKLAAGRAFANLWCSFSTAEKAYKILLIHLSIIPSIEIPELFQKLFAVVKNMLKSSVQSNRILAVSVIADLAGKVLERQDMWSNGSGCALASQVISFILDQILSHVTPKVGINHADFDVELEVKSLLNTLFNLVEKYSNLHHLVLDNACLFVSDLMKMIGKVMDSEKNFLSNPEMTEDDSHGKTLLESKIIHSLSKTMAACLENLEYTDTETSHTLDALKLQVGNVCHCRYIGCYTRLMSFLLLHLHSTFICMKNLTENLLSPCNSSSFSCDDSVSEFDKSILGCAKDMLEKKNNWCAYKAGKKAACQGAWSTSAFIFEQLTKAVKSPSCSSWLKSLAQIATSENQIQRFVLSGQGRRIVPDGSGLREIDVNSLRTRSYKYKENLLRCCDSILCAEEKLGAPDVGHMFSFQRWFLTLRAKVLKHVADMMNLLDSISSIQDGTGSGGELDKGAILSHATLGPFINTCMEVSCHMKKLAEEYDLLLTSFMGMDRQSVMSVSALALSCSIMAFTAGFAFLVPDLYFSENYKASESGYREGPLHALLIEDLLGRLKHIDCKTRKNLLFLLKPFRSCNRCSSSRFKVQTRSYETVVLHKLCEYSVGEVFSLRSEAAMMQGDADALYRNLIRGSEVLMNVISNLMSIPFHTPHHFFRVRSAVSSELFIMNEDGQALDGSSISLGSPLSLSLRFQLKNMPGSSNKVYCILSCKSHSSATTEIGECKWQARLRKQEDEIDSAMELNEKLLRYVTGSVEARGWSCRRRDNDCLKVNEYARFEVNEGGQGFSTCFLDTSILGVGDYRITWHCGYVDSEGCYWSLLPVNDGPLLTVEDVKVVL